MVATGVDDVSCLRSTTPRLWSGFGSQQLIGASRQVQVTVQFNHNGTPFTSLAVWMDIAPNETIRFPLLFGQGWSMHFHSRSYHTLPSQPDGQIFGEFTLSHISDYALGSAAAYVRNC